MLNLPPRFAREISKAARQPFALLEILGAGQSDEATTETDWGANVGESNIDYTPTPPESGDVILAAAAGENTTTNKCPPTSDISNNWSSGNYTDIDEWPAANDADYLRLIGTAATSGKTQTFYGAVGDSDLSSLLAEIPENAHIKSVIVMGRGQYDGSPTSPTLTGGIRIGTTNYLHGTAQSLTTGWADYDFIYTTNPATSLAWTREDLATVTGIGIQGYLSGTDSDAHNVYCSQLYLEVIWYDFEGSGSITVQLDLTAAANTDNDGIVSIDDQVPTGGGLTYKAYIPGTGSTMRPTNHYDRDSETVNEADAYDGDDTDASTMTADGSNSDSCYYGCDSGNSDAWETEPTDYTDAAFLSVVLERAANGGTDYLGVFLEESDGTAVATLLASGTADFAKTTVVADVSAWIGDLADLRVVVKSGLTPDNVGTIDIYDIWIEVLDGVSVADGSEIDGAEEYYVRADFTSDASVTPVLRSIRIDVPDHVYRYSTLRNDTLDAHPLVQGIPNRNIEIDLKDFVSKTSDFSLHLVRTDFVDWMLRNEYMRGLNASIRIGMYFDGVAEDDLVPYQAGRITDVIVNPGSVTLKLSDTTKDLNAKWPEGTAPSTKVNTSKDGTHMADVIEDVLDDLGISARFVDRGSIATVKANIGDGDPTAARYVVYRGSLPPEDNSWDTTIVEEDTAKNVLAELCELMGCYIVIQENGKLQLVEHDSSTSASDTWDDNVVIGSPTYTQGLDQLKNQCYVYYDWNGEGNDASDYASLYISADATSVSNWGITLTKVIKSKWISGDSADGYYGDELAAEISAREVARLKDGVGQLSLQTTLDKCAYQVGDFITIDLDVVINPDVDQGATRKFIIVSKNWNVGDDKINWKLIEAR